MEHNQTQEQLQNSTLILVLGILSIIGCCCYGILGIILGVVTLVLAKKATAIYMANPEMYTGFQNVKIGRILAIIGLVLSAIYLAINIYFYVVVGVEGIEQMQKDLLEQLQQNQ
ncbi:CCC motif membrane protein [Psychroserpens sp. Hel_I_66]|uniref:CCC motif membrane protein n=1 Tax=Psychroserpens sp. Hel_I_66 TaxID=1250004 RepID=UPI0006465150|nr:CCC motif membrane protein [Psychroserpens sp. Hel_I_66]